MSLKKVKLSCCKLSFLGRIYNLWLFPLFLNKVFYIVNGMKYETLLVSTSSMFYFKITDFILSKQMGPIHRKKQVKNRVSKG